MQSVIQGITKNFDKMSLSEVKRAFTLFDINQDGMIDEKVK